MTADALRCSQLFHAEVSGQRTRYLIGGIPSLAAGSVVSIDSISSGSGERSHMGYLYRGTARLQ
jgi:hypothetical protein